MNAQEDVVEAARSFGLEFVRDNDGHWIVSLPCEDQIVAEWPCKTEPSEEERETPDSDTMTPKQPEEPDVRVPEEQLDGGDCDHVRPPRTAEGSSSLVLDGEPAIGLQPSVEGAEGQDEPFLIKARPEPGDMSNTERREALARTEDQRQFAKEHGAEPLFIADCDIYLRRLLAEIARRENPRTVADESRQVLRGFQAAVSLNLTDLGNAERLVFKHGRDLRFCSALGWLVWEGKRWAKDETGEVVRRAKDTVRGIYAEAAACGDEERRKALAAHAKKSEAEARIVAMISLAESEPGIPVLANELDVHPWLLNVANGTVDLRTGALRPHKREDLITKLIPIPFESEAQCPIWHKFLAQITGDNGDLAVFLQRAVGYSLTGDTREQCFFILWGTGSNGKSTFISTISYLLGDYATATPAETILVKHSGGIPNDVARLKGARFVSSVEMEAGKQLAESLLKAVSGGDTIVARFLHREYFEFQVSFKLWMATNHKPVVLGTDGAIWRRIKLIPFSVTIPDEGQDKDLPDKLRAEAAGILRWAVEGCLSWQEKGLGTPEVVREATATYRDGQDVLADFIDERCVIDPAAETPSKELYAAYARWAGVNKPLSPKAFSNILEERGFIPGTRTGRKGRTRKGIRIRGDVGDVGDAVSDSFINFSYGKKPEKPRPSTPPTPTQPVTPGFKEEL